MSRYIDADAFKEDVKHHLSVLAYAGSHAIGIGTLEQWFDNAPSIDIVRCEECRKSHIDGKTTHYLWCTEWGRSTDTFGYCERGERGGQVMTRQDAIYEIKQLAVLSNEKNIDRITEALEMAIEALQNADRKTENCSEKPNNCKTEPQKHCYTCETAECFTCKDYSNWQSKDEPQTEK